MKPETLVKLSVALLLEAEQEFRYRANQELQSGMACFKDNPRKRKYDKAYESLTEKADAVLEVIDKLNKI
jgi:hypothetical protein